MSKEHKPKILIVDDEDINRSMLNDMLSDDFELVEAEDGKTALHILQQRKNSTEIALVLLDNIMPEMRGLEVLEVMNANHWLDEFPVIMISSDQSAEYIERAYELGVTEFISRPFNTLIVRKRVINTIMLFDKQKRLVGLVADQIYEKEQRSSLMIDILSHIVEFRNGESGLHVLHVRTLTELLLNHLVLKTDRYNLTAADISMISTASALHDIGKIAIDESILNKPGKLTDEEFAIMKTHSRVGADMLDGLPIHQKEPLVKEAYKICRWHHERYDGRGYPDGLKGDEIPISAQIVALADVYDALTSKRVYKPPFPHEKAVDMIVSGQCGTFNPLVLECLTEISDDIQAELNNNDPERRNRAEMRNIAQEMSRHEELTASERTLQLLEHERMKYSFFAALTKEIQFEYTTSPSMLTLSTWGAERLGLDEIVMDPMHNEQVLKQSNLKNCAELADALRSTSPEHPDVKNIEFQIDCGGEKRWFQMIARAIWSSDEPPRYTGAIGKAIDIHDSRMRMNALEHMASHDTLTGLLNHAYAKNRILERLKNRPAASYALVIFDLDHFKQANDTFGHSFGDEVLIYVAEQLRQSIRGGDIAARAGGDEFLIFFEYKDDVESIISRIFRSLCGQHGSFRISLSMGVALTSQLSCDYDTLFHAADQALYHVKRGGRGRYCFYEDDMKETLSAISPIDGGAAHDKEE